MKESIIMEIPLLEAIANRRSSRAFATGALTQEIIQSLFEAARWAPSSVNEQPWTYIYATKDQHELWSKILDTLNDSNKVWAKEAPLFVVSLARKMYSRNGKPNNSGKYDVGAANAFLSLQATSLGLNVRQMGGFDQQKVIINLNVPDTYEPLVVMAIGYPGNPDTLTDQLRLRELAPRERQSLESFVMNKSF